MNSALNIEQAFYNLGELKIKKIIIVVACLTCKFQLRKKIKKKKQHNC